MRHLFERTDGFDYVLRMNCDCGTVTPLSQDAYVRGEERSRMPCPSCGGEIHYGPAVAAIRDPKDPVLDNGRLTTFSWYHTSSQLDWPSPAFTERLEREIPQTDRTLGPSRESFIASQASKALHVGTYEAAIENMMRRMDDQGDGDTQFYLYRVALNLDSSKVNAGYRDENHEVASDISVHELDVDELAAVRYLNVHEAIGSLSVAIRPSSVEAVQCVPLPIPDLRVGLPADITAAAITSVKRVTRDLADAGDALGANRRHASAMSLGLRPDPDGLAKRLKRIERAYYERWNAFNDLLAETLLPEAGALVRRNFNDALAHRRGDDVDEYIAKYRGFAALVARGDDVIKHLSGTPWRAVSSGPRLWPSDQRAPERGR